MMDIMHCINYLKEQLQNGNDCQFKMITQNVDGLHERSGFDDDQIVEMHGSASKYICSIFDHDMNEQFNIDFNHKQFIQKMKIKPFKCNKCGIWRARPNVILFL